MLDSIAALALGAMFTINLTVLVGLARIRATSKAAFFALAAAWAAVIVTITGMGGFAPGVAGPVPAAVIAFGLAVVGGLVAWLARTAFRDALLSIPLAALVGVHGLRIGGVFFLLLYAQERLPAPFAPSAGWGDIVTGVAAIILAILIASRRTPPRRVLALWNVFGAVDLIVAATLAFLSTPGAPWRIFSDPPGTSVMTTIPWIVVATMLVPLYLLVHLTIAVRLQPTTPGTLDASMVKRIEKVA